MSATQPPSGPSGGPSSGPCAIIVDRLEEELCGKLGYEEILVSNAFGLYAVWLCRDHKAKHTEFYSRSSRPRRRKRVARASQSRGSTNASNNGASNAIAS